MFNQETNSITNAILLSSTLLGSIYMYSSSITNINKMFLKSQINYSCIIMNGFIIISSGFIIGRCYSCGLKLNDELIELMEV